MPVSLEILNLYEGGKKGPPAIVCCGVVTLLDLEQPVLGRWFYSHTGSAKVHVL